VHVQHTGPRYFGKKPPATFVPFISGPPLALTLSLSEKNWKVIVELDRALRKVFS
jgi:hypothetical protein